MKRHFILKFACFFLLLPILPGELLAHVADSKTSVEELIHDFKNPEHSMILSFALQDEKTQKIWAVGEFGSILSTEDLGETWVHTESVPTDITLTSVRFKTPLIGFAAGYDSQILKTTDGGKSWHLVHNEPEWEQPIFKIIPFDKHVIAIGAYGLFMISFDEGETWKKVKLPFDNAHLYDLIMAAPDEYLLVGEMGVIRKAIVSADGNLTFSEIHPFDKKSIFGIYPEREGHYILLGLQGSLLSYDLAQNVFVAKELTPVASLFGYDQLNGRKILVGASGHIFTGLVDEDSFTAHQLPSRQNLSDVFLLSPDLALVCGDGGIEKIHLSMLPASDEVTQ